MKLTRDAAEKLSGVGTGTLRTWETPSDSRWPSQDKLALYLEHIGVDPKLVALHFNRGVQTLDEALANEDIASALDAWTRANPLADFHEFQRFAFKVETPRVMRALAVKAETGDVPACKLWREWHNDWAKADSSLLGGRTIDVSPKQQAWITASLPKVEQDGGVTEPREDEGTPLPS